MAVMERPNYKGLIYYLRTVGLDALRIPADSVDESGFDYYDVDEEGRPKRTGTNRIVRQRREWPSQLVYTNVLLLMQGGELPDVEVAGKKLLKAETDVEKIKAVVDSPAKPQAVKRTRKPKEEPAE